MNHANHTNTKSLTISAMMTALGLVLLYLACVLPTGRLALVALAAMLPAAAVLSGGLRWGMLVYLATAALGLVMLPNLGYSLLYAVLLGHYAVVKSLIERLGRRWLEIVCKLAVFNGLLAALYGLCRLLGVTISVHWAGWALVLAANAVFLAYDYAFTCVVTQVGKYFR